MSFLKSVFSGAFYDATDLGHSPSFNDFSLHVGQDTTEVEATMPPPLERSQSDTTHAQPPRAVQSSSPKPGYMPVGESADHLSEFVMGKNVYMKNLGTDFYDNVADPKKDLTVWQQIARADSVEDAFKTCA